MTRDPLDALLEDPMELPDDGFTARVMEALPPPRRAAWPLQGWPLVLAAGAAAAVLAPDATRLAQPLAAGLGDAAGALARLLAAGGGGTLATLVLAAVAVAAGCAAVGAWLVAEPA